MCIKVHGEVILQVHIYELPKIVLIEQDLSREGRLFQSFTNLMSWRCKLYIYIYRRLLWFPDRVDPVLNFR